MFNWPLKLRQQTDFCMPKGPSFKFSGNVCFSIGGTKISLRAPRHSLASHLEAIRPYNINNFNDLRMRPWGQDKNEWLYQNFFRRQWEFYGPWFSGFKGDLTLDISLISRSDESDSASFFRPKAFENIISDYLKVVHSKDIYEGAQEWLVPMNWRAITPWPCVAATFYAKPNYEVPSHHSPSRYFVFPVSDKHLIRMCFDLRRSCAGSKEERDKQVGMAEIEQLSTDIMNSIQIELSPEAQAQQIKALEGLEDTKLGVDFPPLKLTTPEQDAEYEQYLRDELRTQEILKG